MQETNDFLGQPFVVSSVIDGTRKKQHFFETSEMAKFKRLDTSHYWLWGDLLQMNVSGFHYTIFFPNTTL